MKIFLIGFNKCGTNTIHHYLLANNVRSVHWDQGRLAKRIFRNLAEGDDLLKGYESFDAFTDMEFLDAQGQCYLEAYKLFPQLAQQYPDAVFILNTRDREDWIRSRLAHGNKPYARRQMSFYGASSEEELVAIWRKDWSRHHCRVMKFFAEGNYRFFVCPIDTDLPRCLTQGLPDLRLDETRYKTLNRTGDRRRLQVSRLNERARWALARLLTR